MGYDDATLARYLRPDLLIIDDIGTKQLPKRSGEYLFEIIAFQGRSYRLRNRLGDDPKPKPGPADDSKPASAPTGNRRPKPAKAADDATDQTAKT